MCESRFSFLSFLYGIHWIDSIINEVEVNKLKTNTIKQSDDTILD